MSRFPRWPSPASPSSCREEAGFASPSLERCDCRWGMCRSGPCWSFRFGRWECFRQLGIVLSPELPKDRAAHARQVLLRGAWRAGLSRVLGGLVGERCRANGSLWRGRFPGERSEAVLGRGGRCTVWHPGRPVPRASRPAAAAARPTMLDHRPAAFRAGQRFIGGRVTGQVARLPPAGVRHAAGPVLSAASESSGRDSDVGHRGGLSRSRRATVF